ncbi:DUF1330 domain-containing protein [Actinomadura sp. 6N118]|uniref:DUF1330 domain-containing protein n=1 Tax=Actinomadura sp. 6N118 TaxID=3375151 RepID=UPI0037A3E179
MPTLEVPCPRATGSAPTAPFSDPEKLAAYNKLAGPAVEAGDDRILARGSRVVAHDTGIAERTVLIEFDSFEQAVAAEIQIRRPRSSVSARKCRPWRLCFPE